ncbi:uncharacterized protein LOC120481563 [Pimephales promelas]|uniref:uncharacterized protein LOC120481563 n=1 Tax=Pimephales promelas TaxID=90988 RepID=UPI001955927C|nr:uncharacterized protein LOC120481563 [Pimephales promelas]
MAAPWRMWTIEKQDKLAELWQEQRELYDVSCSLYHDRVVRDDILQRIAQELQFTVHDVQTRMATLRTQFGKLIKEKASGSGFKQPTARQKWIVQHLQFLKPFLLQRPSQSSLELEENTAALGGEDSEMDNETDLSPGLEQSSCDTPCENDQPASGPPAPGYPLCRAKYRSKKNENIEQQKIAILNKVADRISNREDKGEYSFGKQVGAELGRIKNPALVLRLKRAIMSQIYDAQESEISVPQMQTHPGFPMSGSYYSSHPTYIPPPTPTPPPRPLLSQPNYTVVHHVDDTGCNQLQEL